MFYKRFLRPAKQRIAFLMLCAFGHAHLAVANEPETGYLMHAAVMQQQRVTGRVLDNNSNPLPGATVSVKGSGKAVSSGTDGSFSIDAPADAVLVFRVIGYKTQEVAVAGKTSLSVFLAEDISVLDEVTISTGYQQIKRNKYTGAVSTIKQADINLPSLGTIDKMLQGQVPGVAVQNTASNFGTAPKIRIRGSSSITGINEPLWVLDGVPLEAPLNIAPSELYNGSARNLLASALANVNPEDIDEITVLKDATATAMYGTRAVNGVIVITTKRAGRNAPLSITYSANATMSVKPSITDYHVLNSLEQTELNEEVFDIYQSSLLNFSAAANGAYMKLVDQLNRKEIGNVEFQQKLVGIKTVNTDWFDVLYKNTIMQQHSLSISQGGEKLSTRFSVSYYDDPGKTMGENVGRYTLNSISNYRFTDRFSAELMLKYASRNQDSPGTMSNPFSYARNASRAMRPYGDDGRYELYKKGYADFNIINEINNDYINLKSDDILSQLSLNYEPVNRLKLSTMFNLRYANSATDEVTTEFSNYAGQFRAYDFNIREFNERLYQIPGAGGFFEQPAVVLPEGGILDRETFRSRFYTWRGQAEWEALHDEIGHNLNVLLGSEIASNFQHSNFNRNYGYLSATNTFTPSYLAYQRLIEGSTLLDDERRIYHGRDLLAGSPAYVTQFTRNTVAFYGSLAYNYKGRYLLDLSIRNDATNVSGTASQNRFLPTWAIGGAWNLSQEAFMQPLGNTLSNVKLRASYGLRGNAGSRGPDMIAYYENIIRQNPEYNAVGVNIVEPENSSLEFEKEYMFSAGVDFSLLNALYVTANYYRRKNFDLLGYRQVAFSTGYENKLFNWADMKNEGYEISVETNALHITPDFSWSGIFNVGYNKNEVVSDYLGNNPTVYNMTVSEGFPMQGRPLTGLYAFRMQGLNDQGFPVYLDGQGQAVKGFIAGDRNALNVEYQGSRDPMYSGGFTSVFRYRNVALNASFVYNGGHVVRMADYYRSETLSTLFRDDLNFNADFADRWTTPGNEQFTRIPKLLTNVDLEEYYANDGFFNQSVFAGYNRNEMRTINASYLRLRNVSVQYALPLLARKWKVQNLTLGLEGSNLAIWASKRLKGMDPETLLSGINLPPVSSYTFSLSATF